MGIEFWGVIQEERACEQGLEQKSQEAERKRSNSL